MKRRLFAAVLAAAMVLSLAACGGGNKGGSSSSNPGSSSSQPDGSTPDGSQPDASEPEEVTITLNQTEVKLTKAGATFQLKAQTSPEGGEVTFTSSDEKVVTVDNKGVITAVAPGKVGVTVQCEGAEQVVVSVECDWKVETKPEDKPQNQPDASKPGSGSAGGSASSGSSGGSASKVDLQAFYNTITGKYEFGFLEAADASLMDQLYPGMSGVSAEQKLVYITMMTMNNGEFGLVQVKDAKDVDTVKAIFQARINAMVGDDENPGNAWYPSAIEQWANNSRVVSNGNYVMMIVHENCDDIVKEFNALF